MLHRADVVRHLLHAVREACALVQLPVIYAFDNLEGLLAPAGNLQPRRAAAFLEGLAQAVDHTRGFLFLVFFEQGLFRQALIHAGTFAAAGWTSGCRSLAGAAFPKWSCSLPRRMNSANW